MYNITLSYALQKDGSPASQVHNPLITLLQAVHAQGSIAAAAKSLGLSYRHVWGELKRYEADLGQALLVWDKGQAARLSAFGSKLLFAERQAQARLGPQIETLQAELQRSFALAFEPQSQVLTLYASHDEALSVLRHHCASQHLHLNIQFTGSVDALRALNEGRCDVAGFHTLQDAGLGSLTQRTCGPLLQPGLHKLIGFALRTQGLIVPPGNPLGLHTLANVAAQKARFANRALGTGTRLLLDELLVQQSIKSTQITHYRKTEPSHSAVAHAVAHGKADCGLGIAAAAQALGLDFVPLAIERYDLVCLKSALDDPAVRQLRSLLALTAWRKKVNAIAGYRALGSGKVLSLAKTLPWWSF